MITRRRAVFWAGIVVGALVALVVLMAVVGSFLPSEHVASSSARFARTPEEIYRAITSVDDFPAWRPDVKTLERLPDRDGHVAWREVGSHGAIALERIEESAPRRVVTRIADPDLPFGGTWTYVIEARDGGTELKITERGFVKPAIFRFMARFVFGYHGSQEGFLRALGKKFGEDTVLGPRT
ncbi:SRPBCC family protein [bacterium]|nr:SRPBCC family protein [bacterium]